MDFIEHRQALLCVEDELLGINKVHLCSILVYTKSIVSDRGTMSVTNIIKVN